MMRSSLWFWFIAAAISLLPICSAATRDPSITLVELEKLKDKLRQTLENEASSATVSRELQTAPPDCLSTDEEINSMLTSELRADPSSKRIYYVCPGDYYLGQFDPSAPGFFVGGLASFFSRANAEYRCGTAEEPSTDCYFYEGSFQVWITGSPFPEPHEAVKFVGFNFESALGFGVLGDRPGDVTFEDCSFNVSRQCDTYVPTRSMRYLSTYHMFTNLLYTTLHSSIKTNHLSSFSTSKTSSPQRTYDVPLREMRSFRHHKVAETVSFPH